MSHVIEIRELDALVSLLDEPNEDIFDEIRDRVLGYGKQAIPILEEAWVNTFGEYNSIRIERLIEDIKQKELVSDIKSWSESSSTNIIKGLMILSKYYQPNMDVEHYNTLFEKLVRETWLEINESLTALEKIKVINHVFFTVYKFGGDENSTLKSDSYFLNKLFDNKKGNPVSLGMLYMAVAQELKIPIFGVNLPGHFVLVYMDEQGNLRLPEAYNEEDVLFYINAFNDGAAFTRNEIKHYINQMKITSNPEFFVPGSNLSILKRMISELIISFEVENKHLKSEALIRLLAELSL